MIDSWYNLRDNRVFRGWTVPLCGDCNRNVYRSGIPRDCIHNWHVYR